MAVSLDLVVAISQAVAAEESLNVQLITVASTSAESQRVELLVTLGRHPSELRRILLNLSRKEPATFERQLRAKLHEFWTAFPESGPGVEGTSGLTQLPTYTGHAPLLVTTIAPAIQPGHIAQFT